MSKNSCRVSSFHQQPRFSHTPHAVSQEAEKLALCLVRTLGICMTWIFHPGKGNLLDLLPPLKGRWCHHFLVVFIVFSPPRLKSSSYAKTLVGCDPKVLGTPHRNLTNHSFYRMFHLQRALSWVYSAEIALPYWRFCEAPCCNIHHQLIAWGGWCWWVVVPRHIFKRFFSIRDSLKELANHQLHNHQPTIEVIMSNLFFQRI